MMRVYALFAAAAMLLPPAPASAAVSGSGSGGSASAATLYVRARAAEAAGMLDAAAAGYAAALDAAPGDQVLALRAYRQAILAGDEKLARRTLPVLEAANTLPADARLLMVAEALRRRDWAAAGHAVDAIERDDVFSFLVPVLRAWIAYGAGQKNALDLLAKPGAGGALAIAYASEHRALLLLALGQDRDGLAAIRALTVTSADRSLRLRLAAAATLAARGNRQDAQAILDGPGPVLAAARARIADGGTLPGAIDTPAAGIAELLVRVAMDVNRERATPLGLSLARLATFMAPDNSEAWLATADMLASAGRVDAALAALGHVAATDPAADAARLARLQLLISKGEQKEALAEAETAAAKPDASLADLTRLGDLLNGLDRHREAADAYGRALALAEKQPSLAGSRWSILMMRGGALQDAGDWEGARADLRQAVKLAPNQAVALNYLGYAQLQRRENLAEAEKLIERASALQPDDAAITDSLGWTYYLRGDLPRAITTLERAVVGEPAEPEINEHLGDAYWKAGRRYEARYAWRAALVYADDKAATRIRSKIDRGLSPESAAP